MINIIFQIVNIYLVVMGYIFNLLIFLFLVYYFKKRHDK